MKINVWVIFLFLLDYFVIICIAHVYTSDGYVNAVVGK